MKSTKGLPCFKPQRGKFTLYQCRKRYKIPLRFKPQRGKFTQRHIQTRTKFKGVSNPNGVNLHKQLFVSGFHDWRFKPQRGKFTLFTRCQNGSEFWVSNPNGVNLHTKNISNLHNRALFQTPTG